MTETNAKYPTNVVKKIHERIDADFDSHLERCRAFLRQPSVSASGEGILETAGMVREKIESLGGKVRYEGSKTHPIVYGRVEANRPRRLVIYGMYDVQPVEEDKWRVPPFGAEIRSIGKFGECVVARGAVNSKGALAGLFNALQTIADVDELPLDLIFTIEGEEEIGSPHIESFVRAHKAELEGSIGVADFDFSENASKKVTMHLGLKGIVYLELKCRGGKTTGSTRSQHSSAASWIASPVWRLVHALSTLVDAKERIAVHGLYENMAPVSSRDRRLLQRLAEEVDEEAFLREMRAICFKYRIRGVELLKKGLYSPIINIDGIHAGYTGKGGKTVLPRVASANIDIRFGPNLEPEEVVEKLSAHLADHGFDDVEISVREAYTWSKTDVEEPLVQKLIKTYKLHGREPQIWPMATWTAPYFVYSRIVGLPVVAGGLGYGDHAHNPNEYMTVEGLRDFEKFVVTFLYQLASG